MNETFDIKLFQPHLFKLLLRVFYELDVVLGIGIQVNKTDRESLVECFLF